MAADLAGGEEGKAMVEELEMVAGMVVEGKVTDAEMESSSLRSRRSFCF